MDAISTVANWIYAGVATWYGADAFQVIGDHMLAASFAPDSRHRRFLKRVSAELLTAAVTAEDRSRAIEH